MEEESSVQPDALFAEGNGNLELLNLQAPAPRMAQNKNGTAMSAF